MNPNRILYFSTYILITLSICTAAPSRNTLHTSRRKFQQANDGPNSVNDGFSGSGNITQESANKASSGGVYGAGGVNNGPNSVNNGFGGSGIAINNSRKQPQIENLSLKMDPTEYDSRKRRQFEHFSETRDPIEYDSRKRRETRSRNTGNSELRWYLPEIFYPTESDSRRRRQSDFSERKDSFEYEYTE